MTKDEALKLVLDALERCVATCFDPYAHEQAMSWSEHFVNQTIIAIKEALAQPEQEPVAWRNAAIRIGEELSSVGPDGYYDMTAEQWLDWAMEQEPRGKNSLAQPEPWEKFCDSNCVWTDHHPDCKLAQRKPLTDEEIARVVCLAGFAPDWAEAHIATQIVRVLESKLKEKNT